MNTNQHEIGLGLGIANNSNTPEGGNDYISL